MANKEIFGNTITTATGRVIAITPSYGSNLTLGIVFFNSSSGASSVACSHSVSGSLSSEVSVTGSGQLYVFSGVDLGNGDVTFSWSGGGLGHYAAVVVIENGTAVSGTNTGTGSNGAVSLGSVGSSGEDVIGIVGGRGATSATTTSDTELTTPVLSSGVAAVTGTYDPWGSGYTADWTVHSSAFAYAAAVLGITISGGGGGSSIPGGLINGGLVNSGLINSGLI